MTPFIGIVAWLGAATLVAVPVEDVRRSATRTVTVVPGARYQAGWFKQLFLGGHWREAWNTAIEVPVLNVETFDGGLSVDRQGGGNETFNLHLKSANGRTWVFRSVDKDPRRKLDPDTARGWIGDLTQDFISGAHPAAPLVVAPLAEAAGVLEATPQLVVMPDDPRLEEFQAELAGMLGTLEERVESYVPGAEKITDTLDLFERLESRPDESVDAAAYLRVRLVDILVGDWDRHISQYRWTRTQKGDRKVWVAVPRDRDEAFSRFDGALPSITEYYGKPIAGWGDTYPPIDKITFAGQYTDRHFLAGLEREQWEAVTADVVQRLTDPVIAQAVHRLPPPMYAQAGDGLERALRSRRDRLTQASKDYYRLIARDVDVRGTTQAEDFDVDRREDGSVVVSIRCRGEESPYFQRRFVPGETSEIRLYTFGGDDRVVEHGNGTDAILLRVISPPGRTLIADFSPQASATKVYAPLPPPRLPPDELQRKKQDDPRVEERIRYEVFRDWGNDSLFFPQLSYDSTRGLFIGAFLQRTSYGFDLDPYASQQSFGAAWSTTLNRPRIEYGLTLQTRSPVRALLYAAYSGVEQAKYFGRGNETPRLSDLASNGTYDARQDQLIVNPMAEMNVVGPLRARAGLEFKHVWSVEKKGLIAQLHPSGSDGMSLGSAQMGLAFAEGGGLYPFTRKVAAQVTASLSPQIFSNPATFGQVRGTADAAYGGHFLTNLVLSARISGQRNFGTYPFFESAFLGGTAAGSPLDVTGITSGILLRGYDLNRFAGDAAIGANTELDAELGKYTAFLPLRYGVFGLTDVGRVFVDGESSSKWHTGYGGGLWFGLLADSPFFRLAGSLKAALVHSDEGTSLYIASGFAL